MILLLIVLSLIQDLVNSYDIIKGYIEHPDKHDGLNLDSSIKIEKQVESHWIITVHKKSIKKSDTSLCKTLENDYIITKDKCVMIECLVSSKVGVLSLRIYCNKTIVKEIDEDDVGNIDDGNNNNNDQEEVLEHTLTFINNTFGKKHVMIEKNSVYRKPHFAEWYGRPEHVDALLKFKLNGGKKHGDPYSKVITIPSRQSMIGANFDQSGPTWGLDRIDQRFGLLDNQYTYASLGSDIDIYVVDTGIRVTHTQFGGRATFLVNTVGDSTNTDCNGHGTHVAGIMGSSTYGVTKNSSLFAVKVLDCAGNGDLFTIQTGIIAILENMELREGTSQPKSKRSVINFSLGGSASSILDSSIALLSQAGAVVSVSAGNSGADACNYSPARMGGLTSSNYILSTGASDIVDIKPSWSNYGSCVSLTAPGVSILSTWHTSNSATAILSGTSMASPFVGGVAALVLQQNLNLTTSQVFQLVLSWVTPNIIVGTSFNGGGKNLLYSQIVYDESPPPIEPPPITPSIPLSSGHVVNSRASFILLIIVIITLNL